MVSLWLRERSGSRRADSLPRANLPVMSFTPLISQKSALSLMGLSFEIAAKRERVWRALASETAEWWPKKLTAGGAGSKVSFDPRLGGELREEWAGGAGLVWYTVVGLVPLTSLDLYGGVPARLGGPAVAELHFELSDEHGGTRIQIGDSVIGRDRGETGNRVTEGRSMYIGDALKAHLERR